MSRLSRLHDLGLAVACFVIVLVDGQWGKYAAGLDALGVAATALVCFPVAFRRWAPNCMLVVSLAGVVAVLATTRSSSALILPPLILLFTIALEGDRRRSILLGAAMLPVVAVIVTLYSPHGMFSSETLYNAVQILAALAIGDAVRSKRAWARALEDRVRQAEETREAEAERRVGEERLRIARDLHDVVAHAMVAINVQAGVAAHLLDRKPEAAADALTEIKRVSGEALSDLRSTLQVLRAGEDQAPTRPTQGVEALDELVTGVRAAGLDVQLHTTGLDDARLPAQVDAAVHRIAQEALTNVLRHAAARSAQVSVDVRDGRVELEVLDDGDGAATVVNDDGGGHGVEGMRERAAQLGGRVEAGRRTDGAGWRVHATLPLPS